jgi:hypothetical protein
LKVNSKEGVVRRRRFEGEPGEMLRQKKGKETGDQTPDRWGRRILLKTCCGEEELDGAVEC